MLFRLGLGFVQDSLVFIQGFFRVYLGLVYLRLVEGLFRLGLGLGLA